MSARLMRGFTLVELLIVVAIISLLMTIGIAVYNSASVAARDSKRRADIDSISKNLETNYDISNKAYSCLVASSFTGGEVPKDPSGSQYQVAMNPSNATDPVYSGSVCTSNKPSAYKICSLLDGGQGSGVNCLTTANANCYCRTSSINPYQ